MKKAHLSPSFYLYKFSFLLGVLLFLPQYAVAQCPLGSLTVVVSAPMNPEILGNSELCPGTTSTLSLNQTFATYNWSTGNIGPTITVNSANTYSVTVTNAAGCSATAAIQVQMLSAASTAIEALPYSCNGSITLEAGQGFSTYAWSNGGTNQTTTVNTNGNYVVTVTNADGCTATADIAVDVPTQQQVDITGVLEFCKGGNTLLSATAGFSGYVWSEGSTGGTLTVTTPGSYGVIVTDDIGCTDEAMVLITEIPFTLPTITGDLASCAGEALTLTAEGPNYTSYLWSTNQNTQSITVDTSGVYTVTTTAANGCSGTATATVETGTPANTTITGNTAICNGASTQLTATGNFASYNWSNGLTGQTISINQLGTYVVTVTNAQGCTGTAAATVEQGPTPLVSVAPPVGAICEGDAPFSLAASPVGGMWSGDIGANGLVDPAALGIGAWSAEYTYTDTSGCTGTAQLDFEVEAAPSVTIVPTGSYCPSDPVQVLNASPAGGVWGGAANASGEINPSILGPGIFGVTYAITPSGGCAGEDEILVEVLAAPTATIDGDGTICEGSGQTVPISINTTGNGPFELIYTIGGTSPTTVTIPAGANSFNVSTPGVYEIAGLTDANGCTGSDNGQAFVSAVTSPQVVGIDQVCDAALNNYNLVFGITGGDPSSYTVTSAIPGNLTGPPYIYTSDLIPSGSTYQFVVNDANNCNPIVLEGTYNCNCSTDAGTMDLSPLVFCVGETAIATPNGDEILGPNDALVYVLHSGNSNTLGTIYGTSATPSFDFAPPLVAGQTYYISAVAGANNGTSSVDLNDPCLSVSIGTPVRWMALPVGSLSGDATICAGETASLVFSLGGNAPFDVTYSDGTQLFALQNIVDNHSIMVSPTATTTYTLVSVKDGSSAACASLPGSTVTITVNTPDSTFIHQTSCVPAQVGVFTQTFTNQYGCDSTVVLTIAFQAFDEVFLEGTTCDITQTGIFTQTLTNQYGCDSLVTTTVSLLPTDLTQLTGTSCNPAQVGVFTQILTNQYGCDSTVVSTISFQAFEEVFLTATTCDPTQTGVFTQTFTNQYGCDSLVTTTVSLLPTDLTELTGTTCNPTQAGVFTQTLTNQYGCDSLVTTTVSLLPTDLTELTATTCDPTQTGVFTQTLINQSGCDSVVVTTVSLLPPAECGMVFQLAAAQIPCGNSVGSFSIEVLQGLLPMAYSFTSTAGSIGNGTMTTSPLTLSQLPAGQYTVTLTAANGLTATETIEITQATPPLVNIVVLNNLDCSGEPIAALSATATGGFPPYTFLWSNGASTPDISNLGAGTYQVSVSGGFGCGATAEVTIAAVASLEITFTVNKPDCFNEDGGYVLVIAAGGEAPYQFSINGGDFQEGNFFGGLSSGVYHITVMDANGCEATESLAINAPHFVDVELGDDLTIDLGDGISLHPIVNLPDSLLANIVWTGLGTDLECPTCIPQNTIPLVTTTYSITVESADGCVDSDGITVYVDKREQVFVPNAFSPNGDGVNDLFFPFANDNAVAKVNTLLIFNRWGELVFEAADFQPNDPTYGWDGMHKGVLMNPAVFVWFAEITFIDGQVKLFEGDVILMR